MSSQPRSKYYDPRLCWTYHSQPRVPSATLTGERFFDECPDLYLVVVLASDELTPDSSKAPAFCETLFVFLCLSRSEKEKGVLRIFVFWRSVPRLLFLWRFSSQSVLDYVLTCRVTALASIFGVANRDWLLVSRTFAGAFSPGSVLHQDFHATLHICLFGVISDWLATVGLVIASINLSDLLRASTFLIRIKACFPCWIMLTMTSPIRLNKWVLTPSLAASSRTCIVQSVWCSLVLPE